MASTLTQKFEATDQRIADIGHIRQWKSFSQKSQLTIPLTNYRYAAYAGHNDCEVYNGTNQNLLSGSKSQTGEVKQTPLAFFGVGDISCSEVPGLIISAKKTIPNYFYCAPPFKNIVTFCGRPSINNRRIPCFKLLSIAFSCQFEQKL